jgi:hypothetical protein
MKNFEEFDVEDLLAIPYRDLMMLIYRSIPHHHIDNLPRQEIVDLCGRYPRLYSHLSFFHSLVLEKYQPRANDRWAILKNSLEQAIKVVKMQYDTLSRKYTIENEENNQWKKFT